MVSEVFRLLFIMENLEKICQQTTQLARNVGQYIKAELGSVMVEAIEHKSLNNFVSYVDKTSEKKLVEGLGKILPASTFLTEEETITSEESAIQWIIDPLDGTTNFLHQIPPFAISIALQYQKRTVLGVVYEITRDECFYTWEGAAAYLNGSVIKVSVQHTVEDSVIATGFMPGKHDWMPAYLDIFTYFINTARGVRRHGAAAVDLAYVACGRFDAFYEYNLHAWDVAAGALLVQQAGGKVSDFRGGLNYIFGGSIIADNGLIHEEVIKAIIPSSL